MRFMLIRSQNKDKLIVLEQIQGIRIENDTKIVALTDMTDVVIGVYSNNDKANIVLSDIVRFYDECKYEDFMGKEDISFTSRVFVMPKDDEV